MGVAIYGPTPAQALAAGDDYGNNIAGAETFGRGEIISSTVTTGTQVLRLAFFTPQASTVPVGFAVVESGGTAAAATPTLVRIGVWTVNAAGDLTALVASTANDTALLAAANTEYPKALQTPYAFIGGQRYAAGILVVTAAAAPTLNGKFTSTAAGRTRPPRVTATISGQADLPATVAVGSLGTTAAWPYIAFVN
jgi:hypothetical protein